VQFWNDVLAPKFIRFKHILVGGLADGARVRKAPNSSLPVKTPHVRVGGEQSSGRKAGLRALAEETTRCTQSSLECRRVPSALNDINTLHTDCKSGIWRFELAFEMSAEFPLLWPKNSTWRLLQLQVVEVGTRRDRQNIRMRAFRVGGSGVLITVR
jgi:hypothetical protein